MSSDTKISVKRKVCIPKRVRDLVWNMYVGKNKARSKCICCEANTITITQFDCGHVVS